MTLIVKVSYSISVESTKEKKIMNTRRINLNAKKASMFDELISKYNIDESLTDSAKLEALLEVLTTAKVEADLDTKEKVFTSTKPEILEQIKTTFDLPDSDVYLTPNQLIDMASKTAKLNPNVVVKSSIVAHCQSLISRNISTENSVIGSKGKSGNADLRLLEEIELNIKSLTNGYVKTIVATRIYNGAMTSLQTFKNFCNRYNLTELFFDENGKSKPIMIDSLELLKSKLEASK